MKKLVILFVVFVFLLIGCSSPESEIVKETVVVEQTVIVEQTVAVEKIVKETVVVTEIVQLVVTATPVPPTPTREPTATREIVIETQSFTGTGDDVLVVPPEFSKAAVLAISYEGGSNFVIKQLDSNGELIDLSVNTIGNYQGLRPMNWLDDEVATILEIQASGNWTIEIRELSPENVNMVAAPGAYAGNGDDIVRVSGSGTTVSFKCEKRSNVPGNIAVWSFASEGNRSLLVNDICPYEGKKVLPAGTFVMDVTAPGAWEMTIE